MMSSRNLHGVYRVEKTLRRYLSGWLILARYGSLRSRVARNLRRLCAGRAHKILLPLENKMNTAKAKHQGLPIETVHGISYRFVGLSGIKQQDLSSTHKNRKRDKNAMQRNRRDA